MLPLYLSIEGLYSYQSKQEIDFSRLTETGLFGIFGKVGSGKSSILEAITFALYGNTHRLNSNNRAYNMMNLNSNTTKIVFEFIGMQQVKYAFEVSWKRNGKHFDKVSTVERKAYRYEDGQRIPLESNDAEKVIGISYENFNRTIIVPQGQFKEFLELKGTERSKMMKELFHLDTYDLSNKVGSLKLSNDLEMEQFHGALLTLGAYTVEAVQELIDQLEVLKLDFETKKSSFVEVQQKYIQVQELKKQALELEEKHKVFVKLQEQLPQFKQLKEQVLLFQHVERTFKMVLLQLEEKVTLLTQKRGISENFKTQEAEILSLIANNDQQLTHIQSDYEGLEYKKKWVSELKSLIDYNNLQQQLATDHKNLETGKTYINDVNLQIEGLTQQTDAVQQQITKLKNSKIDLSKLLEVGQWYEKSKSLTLALEQAQQRVTDMQKSLSEQTERWSALGLDPTNWVDAIGDSKQDLQSQLDIQDEKIKALAIQLELAKMAHNLVDGAPCLLCGSESHPHIVSLDHVSSAHSEEHLLRQNIEAAFKALLTKEQAATQIETQFAIYQKQFQELTAVHKNQEEELRQHITSFVWTEFDPTNAAHFESEKLKAIQIDADIKKEDQQFEKLAQELKNAADKKLKYAERLEALKNNVSVNSGRLEQMARTFELVNPVQYASTTVGALEVEVAQAEKHIVEVSNNYRLLTETKQDLALKQRTIQVNAEVVSRDILQLERDIIEKETEIQNLIASNNFNSLSEIKTILSSSIAVDTELKRIQSFEEELRLVTANVEDLRSKLVASKIEVQDFEPIEAAFNTMKAEQDVLVGQLKSLEDQLVVFISKNKEKQLYEEKLEKLTLRKSNLKILENMFKANGFVNYISTQYLEDLCQVANVRFERLTSGQLSLTLNDSNEFDVIDHLNSGRQRSVRTLSGGQFFQASLCLALALAESTRSLNKNEKNFFFIDEGFGTQDVDAVHLIFETLQNLQKDNRIVGIISHVEDLKDQIPVALYVEKHEELGSIIQTI